MGQRCKQKKKEEAAGVNTEALSQRCAHLIPYYWHGCWLTYQVMDTIHRHPELNTCSPCRCIWWQQVSGVESPLNKA